MLMLLLHVSRKRMFLTTWTGLKLTRQVVLRRHCSEHARQSERQACSSISALCKKRCACGYSNPRLLRRAFRKCRPLRRSGKKTNEKIGVAALKPALTGRFFEFRTIGK